MMYILTEAEYAKLLEEKKRKLRLSDDKLQKLCTKICNEMPVQWGWGSDKNDPEYFKPWGCVITEEANQVEWYCDQCPVYDICPAEYKPASQ